MDENWTIWFVTKVAAGEAWVSHSIYEGDTSLMEIATTIYNKKGSLMINRCRMYLYIISLFKLLQFSHNDIHPAFFEGHRPPSRKTKNNLALIPTPP
jgi:hypothetical protein